MPESRGAVLIAAVSGRALARASVDAGYEPLVADFFADADTIALASATEKMPGPLANGFESEALTAALDNLAAKAKAPLLGLVYGSGFEDRPQLLAMLSEHWPLLGNSAKTVARINDVAGFFAVLDRHGIAYPDTRLDPPPTYEGWLTKRLGGAGGSHIQPATAQAPSPQHYYQRVVQGPSVSALFVADGREALTLGYSEQWTAPGPGKPWRYGGALQPAPLSTAACQPIDDAVAMLTSAFQLRGLNSADFIIEGDVPYLLEVNPRPGGTLDIFANDEVPLFSSHVDSVLNGALPDRAPHFDRIGASAILFAPAPTTIGHGFPWPDWAADLPKGGERIDKERPICTLLAQAGSVTEARALINARLSGVLTQLTAFEPSKGT